jgi:hypothetical protein
MARSKKEMLDEILSWPECGGFQIEKLAEILAGFEERLEALEDAGVTRSEPDAH